MKYLILFILLYCYSLSLSGCQSKLLTVYKIDVQQGNALEAKTVNKVKLGMNREQVRFVLGSPLIIDSFHPDRWDYIYHFKPGYGKEQRRKLTLIFDRNEVIDIIKDNIVADESTITEQDETDEEDKDVTEEEKELEKQAEELEDILETNKEPIN